MSQENVEMLRRVYPVFSLQAATEGKLDALFDEIADAEIEFRPPPIYPDQDSSFRGLGEFKEFLQGLGEVWDDWRFVPEEFIVGDDDVAVLGYLHARGKGSGVEVDTPAAHVWSFRSGKAVRMQVFLDKEEALEAAGLRE
jgi:ketosteroid isomerase-like protein